MIGFFLVNLLPPGRPLQFEVRTPSGVWRFSRASNFLDLEEQILARGVCGNTYSMEFTLPTEGMREVTKESAFYETLPICLAASFVSGSAVTVQRSLPHSEIKLLSTSSQFPRARGIGDPASCVNTLDEFIQFVERFVAEYPQLYPTEKLVLLSHLFIDACACWSLENLYLSGSTMLQVIAETEKSTGRPFSANHAAARAPQQRAPKAAFFDYLAGAADRVGITALTHDVVKIRNSLIHAGTLNMPPFSSQADAADPISEAMNWIDTYVYAVLQLGPVPQARYKPRDLALALNSFSF